MMSGRKGRNAPAVVRYDSSPWFSRLRAAQFPNWSRRALDPFGDQFCPLTPSFAHELYKRIVTNGWAGPFDGVVELSVPRVLGLRNVYEIVDREV